jgi:Rrf2 family iron-sulfur cluster assembly transcriptional regulator
MLSRGGLYALQAALHLAQHSDGESVSAARVAEGLSLPPEYLAKVLRRLAVEGILESTRGARGGYSLAHDPELLTVAQVVHPFEEVTPPNVCLLGGPCHSERPCPAHLRRLEWNAAREKILAATTLADLLPESDDGSEPEPSGLLSMTT